MSAQNRETLEKVTTGELGSGILNRQQFNEFFQEVQEESTLLDRVRTVQLDGPKQQIDKIGVGERLRESRSEGTAGSKESTNSGTVDMDTVKGGLDWQLTREAVEDNIEGEQLAQRIMGLMSQQFAVDTEDLAINGDESGSGFVTQNDGWLTIADSRGAPSYDHMGNETTAQPIDKSLFHNMLQTIEKKYLRTGDAMFILSRAQMQEFKMTITDRSTGAGDNVLLSDADINPFGYDILAPANWPDSRAMLTDPDNLIYGLHRDVNIRSLRQSDDVLEQDLYGKWSMTVRDDIQVEDANAMVVAENIEAP